MLVLAGVEFKARPGEAARGADALVTLTKWEQFRALDLGRVKAPMPPPVIVELRNVYKPCEIVLHGITYAYIGRG